MIKLFVADVNRDETYINEIMVNEGKYKAIKVIKGSFKEQSERILLLALRERPVKLIVERNGIGIGLHDELMKTMKLYGLQLKEDSTVIYQ